MGCNGTHKDLSGQRFGRLVAVSYTPGGNGAKWFCHCDCGNTPTVAAASLTLKGQLSCGCKQKEDARKQMTRHGHASGLKRSKEYYAWGSMKDRCNPENLKYKARYYDRGIKVCDEWKLDFLAFLNHIGPCPNSKLTVDRINNNAGYEPGNVRWATQLQQGQNRQTNVWVSQGEKTPLAQTCAALNISPAVYRNRITLLGWSHEKAISTPPQKKTRKSDARL